MIKTLIVLFIIPIVVTLISRTDRSTSEELLASHVYNWNALEVERTNSGERRQILDGPTDEFARLEIHATTLNPGQAPHSSHVHADEEELIIVKEGTIKQTFAEKSRILPAGSAVLALSGVEHGISNAGITPTTYYIVKWKTREFTKDSVDTSPRSFMINWNDVEFKSTEKGGRSDVYRSATNMLTELEMHVTTLKPGMTSHAPHQHTDAEIIIVLSGTVEETIFDSPYRAEAGSVIYLASNDLHGIRNVGDTACEYYAIRWIPK